MTKPYGVPPSWNPGYAIPRSIQNEGLRRRAFVTKMAPRGTYDASVGKNTGYATPQYIIEEPSGQGTYTTAWAPRGTAPPIPDPMNRTAGAQISMGGLGNVGTPPANPFATYGQKAASRILKHVGKVPPLARPVVLAHMLNTIDPTLHARTQQNVRVLISRGVKPQAALQQGLAHAMSTGIVGELVNVGRSRRAPQPRSLLGLGCYGCQAMGATEGATFTGATLQLTGTSSCPPPPGFTWNGSNWERLRVGAIPVNGPCGAKNTTTDNRGLVWVSPDKDNQSTAFPFKASIKTDSPRPELTDGGDKADYVFTPAQAAAMPVSWKAWLKTMFTTPPTVDHYTYHYDDTYAPPGGARAGIYDALGITKGSAIYIPKHVDYNPWARVTWPTDNSQLGIYAWINASPAQGPYNISLDRLRILISKIPTQSSSIWADLIQFFIIDGAYAISEGLKDLGNLACDTLGTPGAAAGAEKAAAGTGTPVGAAAAAGVAIASGLCGNKPKPILPVAIPSILPLALAGAAGLVVLAIIKKKHKQKGPV